jgi:hypothetical protein
MNVSNYSNHEIVPTHWQATLPYSYRKTMKTLIMRLSIWILSGVSAVGKNPICVFTFLLKIMPLLLGVEALEMKKKNLQVNQR